MTPGDILSIQQTPDPEELLAVKEFLVNEWSPGTTVDYFGELSKSTRTYLKTNGWGIRSAYTQEDDLYYKITNKEDC